MQTGDKFTETETHYIAMLERLWDMVSDTIESGRLTEASIPDDYAALVHQMQQCEAARDMRIDP